MVFTPFIYGPHLLRVSILFGIFDVAFYLVHSFEGFQLLMSPVWSHNLFYFLQITQQFSNVLYILLWTSKILIELQHCFYHLFIFF